MEWSTRNRRRCYSSDFSSPCRIGLLVISVKESEIRIAVCLPCTEENAPLCHRDPCRHIPLAPLDDCRLCLFAGTRTPLVVTLVHVPYVLQQAPRCRIAYAWNIRNLPRWETDIWAAVCSFWILSIFCLPKLCARSSVAIHCKTAHVLRAFPRCIWDLSTSCSRKAFHVSWFSLCKVTDSYLEWDSSARHSAPAYLLSLRRRCS